MCCTGHPRPAAGRRSLPAHWQTRVDRGPGSSHAGSMTSGPEPEPSASQPPPGRGPGEPAGPIPPGLARRSSAGAEPARVAAFDVDGTLTWTDSFVLFLRFVTSPAGYALRMASVTPQLVAYGVRLADRDSAKTAILTAFLRGMPEAAYRANCAAFAQRAYPHIARSDGLARLANHEGVGQTPVFVSASLEDYLAPWAASLGVASVVATRMEVAGGVLTGRMTGANCRGPEKVARLRAALPGARIVAAYGDSAGDRELLAAADEPGYRLFLDEPRDRAGVLRALWWGDLLGRPPFPAGA